MISFFIDNFAIKVSVTRPWSMCRFRALSSVKLRCPMRITSNWQSHRKSCIGQYSCDAWVSEPPQCTRLLHIQPLYRSGYSPRRLLYGRLAESDSRSKHSGEANHLLSLLWIEIPSSGHPSSSPVYIPMYPLCSVISVVFYLKHFFLQFYMLCPVSVVCIF